jgi:hypothetical protein
VLDHGGQSAGTLGRAAVRLARSGRAREGVLVGAVLAPVALHPAVRRTFVALDRPRRTALAMMVGSALAGQFAVGSRSFPFVNWEMYTTPVGGDPVVFEYAAVLRGGATIPLVLSQFLGPRSAGRLMEALRRQVCRLQAVGDNVPEAAGLRREHELALRAIAARCNTEHLRDPVVTVLVSERTVSIRSGEKSRSRRLWAVDVA